MDKNDQEEQGNMKYKGFYISDDGVKEFPFIVEASSEDEAYEKFYDHWEPMEDDTISKKDLKEDPDFMQDWSYCDIDHVELDVPL